MGRGSLFLGCFLTACTVLPYAAGQLEPKLEEGWATKSALQERMRSTTKVLLNKEETSTAARKICQFEHLDRHKSDGSAHKEWAKVFCILETNDRIFFLKNFKASTGLVNHNYLLVRDGKAYENIEIENKYSKKLGKSIPIVERLH